MQDRITIFTNKYLQKSFFVKNLYQNFSGAMSNGFIVHCSAYLFFGIILSYLIAPVAQWIEQWIPKPCAASSILAGGT
jgi:predicted PurR-regulated permease PerM